MGVVLIGVIVIVVVSLGLIACLTLYLLSRSPGERPSDSGDVSED